MSYGLLNSSRKCLTHTLSINVLQELMFYENSQANPNLLTSNAVRS